MKIYFEKEYKKLKKKFFLKKTNDNLWEQTALPIGNGSLGLSTLGGINKEQITVNCKTFWTGGPSPNRPNYCGGNIVDKDDNGKTRLDYFNEARKELLNGNEKNGSLLCDKLVGEKDGYGAYQCMGEIQILFDNPTKNISNYYRDLDLETAVNTTKITRKKGSVEDTEIRQCFVSYPDSVGVLNISREKLPLNCTILYPSHHGAKVISDKNGIYHKGILEDNGLCFAASLQIDTDGTITPQNGNVNISNATYLNAYFFADTNYLDNYPVFRNGEDIESLFERVDNTAKKEREKGFDNLLKAHIEDYQPLFKRLSLFLGGNIEMPADKLVYTYKKKNCAPEIRRTLEALLYQYGRYLTICASRNTDVLPSNLQGIWNHSNTPAWSCDFHMNINLQMNYMPTFATNLAECAMPLLRYIKTLREPGRITAEIYTGIKSTQTQHNGFLFHTQCTPFGWTCPGWEFSWGWSPACVAWILHNVYEMYEYTCDKKLLEQDIYPMLDETANYFESLLVEKDARLITVPTFSPEHGPRTAGNTYEQSLIWQLFYDTIESAKALGIDTQKTQHRLAILDKLKPIEIGENGQIKEWYHEKRLGSFGQKHHRHLSHLLGLYPGYLVNRNQHPEYVEAAKVSLNDRGDRSTAWAIVQRICSRARTLEGDHALELIKVLIKHGVYVNLWNYHPPFQIDGNYGYTAGVTELLMQSHLGQIDLLPALPKEWKNGEISGLVARGNFELSFSWKDNRLQQVEILSRGGGVCKVSVSNDKLKFANATTENVYDKNNCLVFDTVKGQKYTLVLV